MKIIRPIAVILALMIIAVLASCNSDGKDKSVVLDTTTAASAQEDATSSPKDANNSESAGGEDDLGYTQADGDLEVMTAPDKEAQDRTQSVPQKDKETTKPQNSSNKEDTAQKATEEQRVDLPFIPA